MSLLDSWLPFIILPLLSIIIPLVIRGGQPLLFWPSVLVCLFATAIIWQGNKLLVELTRRYFDWNSYPRIHLISQLVFTLLYSCTMAFIITLLTYEFIFAVDYSKVFLRQLIGVTALLTLLQNALLESLYFSRRWRLNFLKGEVLKREHLRSQFESLKHQVNPHFLFNSLNTLTVLIEDDNPDAEHYVTELQSVYQYVLASKNWKLIALDKELSFVATYLYLLKMRFGDNLHTQVDVPENYHSYLVPPLTLQLLVENAVKHNIINTSNILYLQIYVEGKRLIVRNNLNLKKIASSESTGIGLQNIKARYDHLSDSQVQVSTEEGYFTVRLPLLYPEDGSDSNAKPVGFRT